MSAKSRRRRGARRSTAVPRAGIEAALACHRAGDLVGAERGYRACIERDPRDADAHHLLGVVEHQRGQHREAESLIRAAIALCSESAPYHGNLGSVLDALGRVDDAAVAYVEALRIEPRYADGWNNLGVVLDKLGRTEDAIESFANAAGLDPAHLDAHANLANALKNHAEYAAAADHYPRALELAPERIELRSNHAFVLERLHRLDEAHAEASRVVERDPWNVQARTVLGFVEQRRGNHAEAVAVLREVAASAQLPKLLFEIWCAIGKSLDALGEHEAAFEACAEGHRRALESPEACAQIGVDSLDSHASIERIRDWFSPDRVVGWARSAPADGLADPVLLVGFPRSGTTLAGQLLAAHSGLATVDEQPAIESLSADFLLPGRTLDALGTLDEGRLREYRRAYLDRLVGYAGEDAHGRRVVDKYPMNVLGLGVLHRFFPAAPVVAMVRDPRDACLSCFMQSFALNTAMSHFHDMESTARYYAAVMGLLLHFREALPQRMLLVRYEDLVADPEGQARQMLEFLGLEWEPGVLSFQDRARGNRILTPSYSQVVQPMYRSAAGRWRNYEDRIAPIVPLLEPYLDAFGYGDDEQRVA